MLNSLLQKVEALDVALEELQLKTIGHFGILGQGDFRRLIVKNMFGARICPAQKSEILTNDVGDSPARRIHLDCCRKKLVKVCHGLFTIITEVGWAEGGHTLLQHAKNGIAGHKSPSYGELEDA
jgi:hypothetical protein